MKTKRITKRLSVPTRVEYYARITREAAGGFLVQFPDLPGCLTEGGTIEEALANAAEALSGWLFVAVKENQDVPAPSVHHGRTYHRVEPDMDVTVPLLILWTRKKKGLTQNQMAEALGVSQQAYRKLEIPGKSNPRLKTLSRLCGTLGLELQLRPVA
jgi:antitoxin HicB